MGTLAGGIAHDFNNMLQAILGYASLLKMNTPKDHPSYNPLDVIEKTSVRAAELTKQLLEFARKGKYVIETMNINDLIQDIYKIISRTFDRSIEIRLNLDSRGLLVEGDRSQLTSVILNLCVNARDAMPEGGLLKIETFEKTVEPGELIHPDARPIRYAAVSVTDTGIGMDEETMKHIFEPFFTTKEVGKGTGMGLAMAYGVVQNHGGFITVESSPKRGSRFIIYLPLLEGALKEGVKEMGEFIQTSMSKGRILIIEDEKSIRSFTKKTLEEIGYEVIEAVDGIDAIEVYTRENGKLDLVILDLILPRLNGIDVFKKIKEMNPDQKIIISTGYGLKEHIEELLGSDQIAAFLEKPYTYITLTTALKKALYDYELD
ncbi:MAG: ATP-binding protein [Thermodesulfovibrionales bacterium]